MMGPVKLIRSKLDLYDGSGEVKKILVWPLSWTGEIKRCRLNLHDWTGEGHRSKLDVYDGFSDVKMSQLDLNDGPGADKGSSWTSTMSPVK